MVIRKGRPARDENLPARVISILPHDQKFLHSGKCFGKSNHQQNCQTKSEYCFAPRKTQYGNYGDGEH